MSTTRNRSRFLTVLGILAALSVGLVVGSLRPVDQASANSPAMALAESRAPRAPQASHKSLTTDLSMQLMQAAIDHARQNDLRMSFAVVDASGNAMASVRMDGAGFLTLEIASGKAYATAAFGRPTAALAAAVPQNPTFWNSLTSLGHPIVLAPGALPIIVDDVQVGAMGGSGGTGQQDEDAVRAALDAAGLP